MDKKEEARKYMQQLKKNSTKSPTTSNTIFIFFHINKKYKN